MVVADLTNDSKVSAATVWDTARGQLDDLRVIVEKELGPSELPKPAVPQDDAIDEGSKE